jgi:phosphate transport system protein
MAGGNFLESRASITQHHYYGSTTLPLTNPKICKDIDISQDSRVFLLIFCVFTTGGKDMKIERTVLDNARKEIREKIELMGNEASRSLDEIIQLLNHPDRDRTQIIIESDENFNKLNESIHDDCLTLIARQQPMASDLREIIADLQIATELERIADHIADIARILNMLEPGSRPPIWNEIQTLVKRCIEMLNEMMMAFQNKDPGKAEVIAAMDDDIDQMNTQFVREIISFIQTNNDATANGTYMIWLVHHLERIGDRVTNIGEQILFADSGRSIDWNRSK